MNSAKMNDDELILRRKKKNDDRVRAYRKRKKDLDAMPCTSTVQSGEPVSENIVATKLIHQMHLNAKGCRRCRQKWKRLKSGANVNTITGTCASNTSRELIVNPEEFQNKPFLRSKVKKSNIAKPKIVENCGECEGLKNKLFNKLSVRQPIKTYTEHARAFRARKQALKNAASQELNISSSIISNTKSKTPADSNDLTRITVGVEVHQEDENSQPLTSTLPIKNIKTSTERGSEFRVGEKSLIHLTENTIEDFQTPSYIINATNNNNNTGDDNIKIIFVDGVSDGVRKHRAWENALNNPASQELNVSSSIISNMDEAMTNNDCKHLIKDGTPDVRQACHNPGESVTHVSGCSHLADDLDSCYKIFDDIDMEEHGLLDNPEIKNTFPDITCIKTEVIDYDDEDINDFDEDRLAVCPICSCCFKQTIRIVSHMIKQHQIDPKNVPEPEKTTFKCRFCAKIMKGARSHNAHIRNSHRQLFDKKSTKFEGQPCNLTFLSADSEKIHRVSHHAIKTETSSTSIDLDKQIKIELLSPTISHRVSQPVLKTYSRSVNLNKQIKIEPLSSTIIHRVSQYEIDTELSPQSVDLDKQIKTEPLSLTITHRVSQHEIDAETSSKSVDLDKQIKTEPLSPTITHRVSQHEIDAETSSKSVDLDKQIKIEPLSPTITHRVSQHAIESETSSTSVDLDKQIKIEPLSPSITQSDLKQER